MDSPSFSSRRTDAVTPVTPADARPVTPAETDAQRRPVGDTDSLAYQVTMREQEMEGVYDAYDLLRHVSLIPAVFRSGISFTAQPMLGCPASSKMNCVRVGIWGS